MNVCPKCQKALNCSSKAIYCDSCNNWLHLKYSNVSNIQFAELASSSAPYYYHACISNALPINAVTNTNDVKTDYLGLAKMKDEDIEVGCDYHDINSFNQHSKKNFLVGGCGFFVTDVISEVVLGSFWLMLLGLGPNH